MQKYWSCHVKGAREAFYLPNFSSSKPDLEPRGVCLHLIDRDQIHWDPPPPLSCSLIYSMDLYKLLLKRKRKQK